MIEQIVIPNISFRKILLLGWVFAISLLNACSRDADLRPGKERWDIKTSVPSHSKPKPIDIEDLLKLSFDPTASQAARRAFTAGFVGAKVKNVMD